VQGLGRRQYADLRETQKSAANEAKRNKSISRNQDLIKMHPCGAFFIKYVCCVGFEPPSKVVQCKD